MFLFTKEAELANFADESTLHASNKDLKKIVETLRNQCEMVTEWFKNNDIIVNPDEFQSIFSEINLSCKFVLKINGAKITPASSLNQVGHQIILQKLEYSLVERVDFIQITIFLLLFTKLV